MKIELHDVKVSDLVDGYADNQEHGVVGYHANKIGRPFVGTELNPSRLAVLFERIKTGKL